MSLSEFSVRKPVFMTMVYALLVIISVVFIPKIDQAIYPDINLPLISVMASCGDADPDSVELQVTRKIENAVSGVENLKKIRSYSRSGTAMIILEFNYGIDLDKAESDVSSLLSILNRTLPSWVTSVNTFQINTMITSQSFMNLTVDGPYTIQELKEIATNTVEPLLTRIDGVGDVDISGGGDVEYHVNIDPNRLAAYNLTMSQVSSALASQNVLGTGGTLTSDSRDFTVLSDNRFMNIPDVLNTRITNVNGTSIYVKDLSDVVVGTEKGSAYSYLNGNPTVSISLYEASGASVSKVAKLVKSQIDNINSKLPKGVSLTIRNDNSKNISATISETYNSLIIGVIFAALIIFLFLRDIKSTIIIALSMPISVLFTLMFMGIFKVSMNMVSMSGLILGIGMIVDASIVILENISRYRSEGETAPASAILGSRNMFNAIVASTITTICVFLPLIIYMNDLEMIGRMMRDLVFTVCFSLMCSLFVSVTLVPALAGAILPIKTTTQRPYKGFMRVFDDSLTRFQNRLEDLYGKILTYFIAYKRFLIIPLLLLFVWSFTLFPKLGISLFPQSSASDSVNLSLTLEDGTNEKITEKYVFDMQDKIIEVLPKDAYKSIMANINGNKGTLTITLIELEKQKYSTQDVKKALMPYLAQDASAVWIYSSGNRMSSSKAVDIEVTSDDSALLLSVSNKILEALQANAGMLMNIQSDMTSGAPRVNVIVDKDMADALSISPSVISSTLLGAISGTTATTISTISSTDTYDVVVKLDDKYMNDLEALNSLLIPSATGLVRLDTISSLVYDRAPSVIRREDKRRINHITADVKDGYSSSEAANLAQEIINGSITIPEGVNVQMAGDMRDFAKYLPTLIMVVILALVLVFAVMAAQFESLRNPFIIFATIPLLLIGVIVIHFVMRQPFSIMSILGVVALIGTVVNNGIVLVDSISREVHDYRTPVIEACITCSKKRLRPILMTTLTTILGMVPMAFFPGDSATQMQPIAITFLGGIFTGAFLTLFLSPVLYAIINKKLDNKLADPNSRENQLKAFDGRIN